MSGGNIASRVLPIKIHDIDSRDRQLFEDATGSVMRSLDFIYKESGVNRPLRPADDRDRNQERTDYRNQVNKVANAIKEIISGLQNQSGNTTDTERNTATVPKTPASQNIKKVREFKLPRMRAITVYKLLSVLSLAAFIIMAIAHFSTQDTSVQTYIATILPPEHTNFSNYNGGQFALSPDGRSLAFVANDSTRKNFLWIRPLKSKVAQVLAGTEGASSPFWSPDSQSIGFFADGKLMRIESSRGSTTVICDAPAGRGGSWNSEGEIIFCPTIYPSPLYRVAASGGTPSMLTKLDSAAGHQSHRWPTFLPDGKHFLYCARTATGMDGDNDAIYLGSLDSTFIARIVVRAGSSVSYANGYILYTIKETLFAQPFDTKKLVTTGSPIFIADQVYYESISAKANFTVSENGILAYGASEGPSQLALNWFNRNGQVANGPSLGTQYGDFRISPDKSRLVGTISDPKAKNTDLWIYDFNRNVSTRFTFDKNPEFSPIWSPDGKTIVYCSPRTQGIFDLFKKSSNGESGEILLHEDIFNKYPSDWSRDGRFLLYNGDNSKNRSDTREDIWVLPMEQNTPAEPYLFLQTPFRESNAVFSPDGKWVAYQSDESGKVEIYIRPFPGPGGKWQVSTNGGTIPRWSDDGKELFYHQPQGEIYAVDINTFGSSIEVGKAHLLFLFNINVINTTFDVINNGQLFLVRSSGGPIKAPLTLVVNWPEELKQK